MGKISLREMSSSHNDDFENDIKRSDDMKDLELMAKYERLSDLVLTRLHGNFECTIPKETFMEKVFNGDEVHGDDYQKDEDLHIKLKIVPGSKLYRTELGPETEIAEITPPIHMRNLGLDYGRFPFEAEMMISHTNDYEYDMATEFSDRLEYLEKGSRNRWVQKNADKFTSIEDAGDYYDNNWHLLTDVNYYKENLIRTSKGKEIHRRIVPPNWREPESNEIFYTKPRAVLTVNGKEVDLLPEKLREKIIVDARNHEIKRQLPTNKQADSLINLISKQVEHTLDIPNDIEVEEFAKFIENVDKDVYASVEFQDDDYTFTIDLQSNIIEDDFTTWDLDRTSLKEAKREVESFVKWHKIAVQKEESEPEFKDSLYGALDKLEYEQVLINGELKYGGEWLSEIGTSKNEDEIFGKSVEVYRRSNDGTKVFEIEPKEVLQQSISDRTHPTTSRTSKHQAIEKDAEER